MAPLGPPRPLQGPKDPMAQWPSGPVAQWQWSSGPMVPSQPYFAVRWISLLVMLAVNSVSPLFACAHRILLLLLPIIIALHPNKA